MADIADTALKSDSDSGSDSDSDSGSGSGSGSGYRTNSPAAADLNGSVNLDSVALTALASGALMVIYLLARPYGDAADPTSLEAADAFASPVWVASHLAGAGSLVLFAVLAWLTAAGGTGTLGRTTRWSGVLGGVFVLPYYGAETFALHEIGRLGLSGETDSMVLVSAVRDNPIALTTFGVGLVALAVAGLGAALLWQRHSYTSRGLPRTALWPIAVLAALFLPQFFLDPAARMMYGIAYALAAIFTVVVIISARRGRHTGLAR